MQQCDMLAEPQASDGNEAMPKIYSHFHGNKWALYAFAGR